MFYLSKNIIKMMILTLLFTLVQWFKLEDQRMIAL